MRRQAAAHRGTNSNEEQHLKSQKIFINVDALQAF